MGIIYFSFLAPKIRLWVGYLLEQLHQGSSNEHLQAMVYSKILKISIFIKEIPFKDLLYYTDILNLGYFFLTFFRIIQRRQFK